MKFSYLSFLFFLLLSGCVKSNYKIFYSSSRERYSCEIEKNENRDLELVKNHSHMSYDSKEECERSGNFSTARGVNRTEVSMESCMALGRSYYSDIKSYPYLDNGRKAEDVIREKCLNFNGAFQ